MRTLLFTIALLGIAASNSLAQQKEQGPIVIDEGILNKFGDKLAESLEKDHAIKPDAIKKQLARKTTEIDPSRLSRKPDVKVEDGVYQECVDSVVTISSIYKCNRCSKWHNSTATAWVLTEDGIMVTNQHIFDLEKDKKGLGIVTRQGSFHPVVEILASNKASDVCIFRVEGKGFKPLKLGKPAKVGSEVHVIGHPDGKLFVYTSGRVSRYAKLSYKNRNRGKKKLPLWMEITADYAPGSSGSPILNDQGHVVGMACLIEPLIERPGGNGGSEPDRGNSSYAAMVLKQAVTVDSIRALIRSSAIEARAEPPSLGRTGQPVTAPAP